MRDEAIEEAISKWRSRFRLTDWDIRYTSDQTELDDDKPAAQIEYERYRRLATVRVDKDVPDHMIERIIVHEMLHLVLLPWYDLTFHVLAKHGDSALGVMDHLDEVKERICEQVAEGITGVPWEPMDDYGRRKHSPFVAPSARDNDGDS